MSNRIHGFIVLAASVDQYNQASVFERMVAEYADVLNDLHGSPVSLDTLRANFREISGKAVTTFWSTLAAKPTKASAPKATKPAKPSKPYIATLLDPKGNVVVRKLAKQDEDGKTYLEDKEVTAGFDTCNDAMKWGFRMLTTDGLAGPGFTVEVEDNHPEMSLGKRTYTRDQAVAATWGKRETPTAMHTNKTNVGWAFKQERADVLKK